MASVHTSSQDQSQFSYSRGIFRNQPKSFVKKYKDKTPLKRMAIEKDVNGAILYLSSNLSNYVTGANLVIDGGISAKI